MQCFKLDCMVQGFCPLEIKITQFPNGFRLQPSLDYCMTTPFNIKFLLLVRLLFEERMQYLYQQKLQFKQWNPFNIVHNTCSWQFYLKYAKERLTCSLPISSIQTMSYVTCKVEIENFTHPSLHYFTSPMNCLITWIRRRYLLLFFWTCPKLLIAFDTI